MTQIINEDSHPVGYTWKKYKRTNIATMRPYILGEDLSNISVSKEDDPETDMGMIAMNPDNPNDQWYVSRQYFNDNFERIEEGYSQTMGEV